VVLHGVDGVTAEKLESELWARPHIRTSSQRDQYGTRQSCHIYNSEAEIDATLEIVSTLGREA
jgi:selenocysteine lyase/cysteine desulfurase